MRVLPALLFAVSFTGCASAGWGLATVGEWQERRARQATPIDGDEARLVVHANYVPEAPPQAPEAASPEAAATAPAPPLPAPVATVEVRTPTYTAHASVVLAPPALAAPLAGSEPRREPSGALALECATQQRHRHERVDTTFERYGLVTTISAAIVFAVDATVSALAWKDFSTPGLGFRQLDRAVLGTTLALDAVVAALFMAHPKETHHASVVVEGSWATSDTDCPALLTVETDSGQAQPDTNGSLGAAGHSALLGVLTQPAPSLMLHLGTTDAPLRFDEAELCEWRVRAGLVHDCLGGPRQRNGVELALPLK